MMVQLRYWGWLGVCPVLIGRVGDASPVVRPAKPVMWPLLHASVAYYQIKHAIAGALGIKSIRYKIVIRGEVNQPVSVEVDD